MNPETPQPYNSPDYLNQIAPKPAHKISILRQKPVMIGAAALGVIILITVFAVIAGIASGGTSSTRHLAARLLTTQSTVDSAVPNIKSTQLRALNSNLKIFLTNTIRDATPIMASDGIDITKLDKDVLSSESNTKMLATLEDARLNAIYDRVYAREMAYRLDSMLTLMNQIYSSSGNTKLKTFLNTSYKSLSPTQKQFANFNETSS